MVLLGPGNGQPAIIGEFVGGQPHRLAAIEDRGDDVGGEETEADDAGDVGGGDPFGRREFTDAEALGEHAVAQMPRAQDELDQRRVGFGGALN